jgi:hypothetical protein
VGDVAEGEVRGADVVDDAVGDFGEGLNEMELGREHRVRSGDGANRAAAGGKKNRGYVREMGAFSRIDRTRISRNPLAWRYAVCG